MSKTWVAVLAFIAGGVVGALALRAYVKANPLAVLGPGAAQQLAAKILGTGALGTSVGNAAAGLVQGLV